MMTPSPATTRWTGQAHDHLWDDPGNWTGGVPVGGTIARFGRGNVSLDLSASDGTPWVGEIAVTAGKLRFDSGRLQWQRVPYDRPLHSRMGLKIDGGGSVTIAAGMALLGAHEVALGDISAATLDIMGTLTDAGVTAGQAGAASIVVEGSGARWETTGIDQSFQLGGNAKASLVVRGGARVDDGAAWGNPDANTTMTIGGAHAGATALVTGSGSTIRFQIIDVGERIAAR